MGRGWGLGVGVSGTGRWGDRADGPCHHGQVSTRVLVSLLPGVDPAPVTEELTALGAESVQLPQPELPDVCIALVDESAIAPQAWAEEARNVAGVAYAEVDQLRWAD